MGRIDTGMSKCPYCNQEMPPARGKYDGMVGSAWLTAISTAHFTGDKAEIEEIETAYAEYVRRGDEARREYEARRAAGTPTEVPAITNTWPQGLETRQAPTGAAIIPDHWGWNAKPPAVTGDQDQGADPGDERQIDGRTGE